VKSAFTPSELVSCVQSITMSEFNVYLNNPDTIADYEVTLENREESVLEAVRKIVPQWKESKVSDVRVQQLSGGITNTMYLLHWTEEHQIHRIIVRLFGTGTELLINRNSENILFAALSELNMGCPIFHGLFKNGRIEGYLPARSINADEMRQPFIYKRVAAATGRFHSRGSTLDDKKVSRKNRMHGPDGQFRQYIELVEAVKFPIDSKEASSLPGLELEYMKTEVEWFASWLEKEAQASRAVTLTLPLIENEKQNVFIPAEMLTNYDNHRNIARYLGFQEVLCHYDILCGNILLDLTLDDQLKSGKDDDGTDGITLIDYEYSAFTHRAFDIGNFFCEFAGFELSIESSYPGSDIRRSVITAYFDACAKEFESRDIDTEKDTEGRIWLYWQGLRTSNTAEAKIAAEHLVCEFETIANQLTLCAHTLWYLWGIVQADISTVDFDYMEYSKIRLDGYKYHKSVFHSV
jgi:ethanolamine kinase